MQFATRLSIATLTLLLATACETTTPPDDAFLVRPMYQRGFASLAATPSKEEADKFKSSGQSIPLKKTYQPNYHGAFGAAVGAYGLSIAYAKGFRPDDDQSGEKGKTDANDLQLHFSLGPFGIDLAHQRFKGFYEEVGTGTTGDFVIHPGMEMQRSAANLFIATDPESFQYDASFGQSRYSDKSGWTFLAMLSWDESEMNHLPPSLTTDLTVASTSPLRKMASQSVGILGGIGLRGIIPGKGTFSGIFGSIAALGGPALQRSEWQYEDGSRQTMARKQVIKTNARFAFGVDKGGWFAGTGFWGDTSLAPGKQLELEMTSNQIESFCGMRF